MTIVVGLVGNTEPLDQISISQMTVSLVVEL